MVSILDKYRSETDITPKKSSKSILEKYRTSEDVSIPKDIAKQSVIGATKGLGGAAGNIRELLHINPQEALLPGQKEKIEREFAMPEKELAKQETETIAPEIGTGRFPTGKDVDQFLKLIGVDTKAATPAGEIAGKGFESAAGSAALGGGPIQILLALSGGASGQGIRELGGPEWLANAVDIGINMGDLARQGLKFLSKKPVQKASGLAERKFESIEKPTKVTPATKQKAIESVEKEFKGISEEIQQSTNKSLRGFREDPSFEGKLSKGFEKLREEASQVKEKIPSKRYQKYLLNEYKKTGKKGFELSESERKLKKYLKEGYKFSHMKFFSFEELVDQTRKNNKELGKYLPFGPNAVENEAKREALLIKNRAIAETIEKDFSHIPQSHDFKFLNERWSEVQKIKTADSFVNSIFKGDKIDFNKAKKALAGGKQSRNLENAFGKENFQRFKGLVSDLMEQEKGMKFLKAHGYTIEDIGAKAIPFLLEHKKIGKFKIAKDYVSQIWRRGLADPKFSRDWSQAVKLFNKGRIDESLKIVNTLQRQMEEED